MRLIKRLKTCLVSLALISFASSAAAMPGKYASVKKGDPSPFSGYCFDVPASAYIIADKEIRDMWCDAEINKKLAIQKAEFDLRFGKSMANFEYENSINRKTIDSLREENRRLESTALDASNNYWYVFFGAGTLAGIVTTILVVQVAK